MTRYNSTGNRGRSGLGVIISGYVDKLVKKPSHLIHSIATPSLTAQSGEESILVASLRGVIAKQAADIEALQSKLKELTTTSLASAEAATSEASQSAAKFSEVRYIFLYLFHLGIYGGTYLNVNRSVLRWRLPSKRSAPSAPK
jgi:hypothetical protein